MTVYQAAEFSQWSEKAKRNVELVVKGSAQDVSEIMTRRQEAMWRADTGQQVKETFEVGRVPVDTGELISSVVVEIGGTRRGKGQGKNPPDFAAAIAGFEIGQDIVVAFTAPYARRLEYGFSGDDSLGRTYNVAGRFFVRNAVQQWRTIVGANAALFKD